MHNKEKNSIKIYIMRKIILLLLLCSPVLLIAQSKGAYTMGAYIDTPYNIQVPIPTHITITGEYILFMVGELGEYRFTITGFNPPEYKNKTLTQYFLCKNNAGDNFAIVIWEGATDMIICENLSKKTLGKRVGVILYSEKTGMLITSKDKTGEAFMNYLKSPEKDPFNSELYTGSN